MFIFLDTNDFKEHLGQRFPTGGHLQIPKNLWFSNGDQIQTLWFEFFSIWRGDFYPIRTKHPNTAILANRAGSTVN